VPVEIFEKNLLVPPPPWLSLILERATSERVTLRFPLTQVRAYLATLSVVSMRGQARCHVSEIT